MNDTSGGRPFDLVVKGGTVANASGVRVVDVGVRNGKVAAMRRCISENSAERVVDATGLVVTPGGVDAHTHFAARVGQRATADGYLSGSRSAAVGGITTYINYIVQDPRTSLKAVAVREARRAESESLLDFGLHVILVDPMVPNFRRQLEELVRMGIPSVKVFTAVDAFRMSGRAILEVLSGVSKLGIVVNLHAEDGALVDYQVDQLRSRGRVEMTSLPLSRPPLAEEMAIRRVAGYCELVPTPLYVVHVSSRRGLGAIAEARQRGVTAYAETRPAYLFLDEREYAQEESGRIHTCWPPLRGETDRAALWSALGSGFIQTYATDHTRWMRAEKLDAALAFDEVPGGFANVETSLGMLYSEGVLTGRIGIERFVGAIAANPAKIFGLWPEKGQVAMGSDADMVLFDPNAEHVISVSTSHSSSDVEAYEGTVCRGWPVMTIARGEVIFERKRLQAEGRRGRFVPRQPAVANDAAVELPSAF